MVSYDKGGFSFADMKVSDLKMSRSRCSFSCEKSISLTACTFAVLTIIIYLVYEPQTHLFVSRTRFSYD